MQRPGSAPDSSRPRRTLQGPSTMRIPAGTGARDHAATGREVPGLPPPGRLRVRHAVGWAHGNAEPELRENSVRPIRTSSSTVTLPGLNVPAPLRDTGCSGAPSTPRPAWRFGFRSMVGTSVKILGPLADDRLHRMAVDRMGCGLVCRSVPGVLARAAFGNREGSNRRLTVIEITPYYQI